MQSEARVAIWSVFINTRKLMEQFSHLQWPLTGCIWGSRVCSESTAWRWRVCPRDTAAHAGTCHHTRHTSKMFDGVSDWGQNDDSITESWFGQSHPIVSHRHDRHHAGQTSLELGEKTILLHSMLCTVIHDPAAALCTPAAVFIVNMSWSSTYWRTAGNSLLHRFITRSSHMV